MHFLQQPMVSSRLWQRLQRKFLTTAPSVEAEQKLKSYDAVSWYTGGHKPQQADFLCLVCVANVRHEAATAT